MEKDIRQVVFVGPLRIEFNSNGCRVRRLITIAEKTALEKLISEKDYFGIDSFCYRIV